jgi:hypothetical protein
MNNERLKKVLKLIVNFSYVILKQLMGILIIGATYVMFYEAGKADFFGSFSVTNEYCEQREKDLNQIIDDLELELSNINNGDVYGEE